MLARILHLTNRTKYKFDTLPRLNYISMLKNRKKLRSYLNIKMSILGFITVVLLAYVFLLSHLIEERAYKKQKENLIKRSALSLDSYSINILQIVKQIDMLIHAVRMHHIQNNSIEQTILFIQGLNIDTVVIEDIFIVDENGYFLSSDPLISKKNVRDRDYYLYHKAVPTDNLFISSVEKGKISGKYRFRITRRFDKPDGSLGGIIIVTVNPKAISLFFEALSMGNHSVTNLLGIYDRKLRARYPEPDDAFWAIPVALPFWETIDIYKSGHFEYISKLDSINRIAAFKKVGDLPLVVMTGFSEGDIKNAIAKDIYWLIILEVITIIAVLSISIIVFIILNNRNRLLLANKELMILNAKKKRFIRILGHDLINPFNRILGYSEMLSGSISSYSSEQIEEMAELLHDTASNTHKLLEDLLLWSQSQDGNFEFFPRKINLAKLCDEVLQIHRPLALNKNIQLNSINQADFEMVADRNMLLTVLRNLISNAIKFTHPNGEIRISAERRSEKIVISVIDNGVGISEDNINKLFDEAHLITTQGTQKEKGSGLGLLLCKEFIAIHGGDIWAESVEGKGSKFVFTLPDK